MCIRDRFTAWEYTSRLEEAGVAVSRDGRGRALDNVFVERLWRSMKYEDIYIKDYELVSELESGLGAYFWFYDEERPHQSVSYTHLPGGRPGRCHPFRLVRQDDRLLAKEPLQRRDGSLGMSFKEGRRSGL